MQVFKLVVNDLVDPTSTIPILQITLQPLKAIEPLALYKTEAFNYETTIESLGKTPSAETSGTPLKLSKEKHNQRTKFKTKQFYQLFGWTTMFGSGFSFSCRLPREVANKKLYRHFLARILT